ncbi:MAG: ABC transporter ATP-binding protein [Alphaproteobacteria bacterium]|nr:MAG: ABC transporter ATP-binding protein [Alphaproteobacteria bacterium]
MTALLQVDGLAVSYGPIQAVREVSLDVRQGEIVAVLGANGAGKSTTLQSIVGLVPLQKGQIILAGRTVSGLMPEQIVRLGMTLTPEGRRIFGAMTVEENLRVGGATSRDRGELSTIWDEMMELFPILASRRRQTAGTLSGGEQQMLAIARSLMSQPKLLLLDEPSLGLAPKIVESIFELIQELRRRGRTILVVEQNVHMVLEIADRGYVIANGEVVMSGTAQDLAASNDVERAYMGRS